jgi:hypothetical protein
MYHGLTNQLPRPASCSRDWSIAMLTLMTRLTFGTTLRPFPESLAPKSDRPLLF